MSKILIIAEAGISHGGSIELAKEMVRQVKSCGADIFKTQLYDVDTLFPDKKIIAQNKNWYDEVKKTQLTKEQVFELADYCKQLNIEFMASAFDLERLGWLEKIGVKRHKIANRHNKNSIMLNAMRETDKEIIISTYPNDPFVEYEFMCGLCASNPRYKFLYCVSNYPTELKDLHLSKIDFRRCYDGLSDHSTGIEVSMIAMARGATIIEKHFCLKRDNSNPDMVCSIEPNELKTLVQFARKVEDVL